LTPKNGLKTLAFSINCISLDSWSWQRLKRCSQSSNHFLCTSFVSFSILVVACTNIYVDIFPVFFCVRTFASFDYTVYCVLHMDKYGTQNSLKKVSNLLGEERLTLELATGKQRVHTNSGIRVIEP